MRVRLEELNKAFEEAGFNPRTREGATFLFFHALLLALRFNPRTREGATVPLLVWLFT